MWTMASKYYSAVTIELNIRKVNRLNPGVTYKSILYLLKYLFIGIITGLRNK